MKNPTVNAEYDLVIVGGGASGLLFADQLMSDPFYSAHRILIIEKDEKTFNDRTWCYWEVGKGAYDDLLCTTWEEAEVKSVQGDMTFSMAPYRYKMLRSAYFYSAIHEKIAKATNMELLRDEVLDLRDMDSHVAVVLGDKEISANKVFNSVRDLGVIKGNATYPLLQQHFVGWFVKTKEPVFNASKVTLMDFSVPQKGNTRFMYLLPQSANRALLEYTLFSAEVLEQSEYEEAIEHYLSELGVTEYEVVEKEAGNIPMSSYPFHKANTANMMYIGTAGGWTKPSTGYTFYRALKRATALAAFLKSDHDLRKFKATSRFDLYDRIFLEVLYNHNGRGAELFGRLFQKNKPERIFKFLDDQTQPFEELRIIATMPQWLFLKHLLRILGKVLSGSSH